MLWEGRDSATNLMAKNKTSITNFQSFCILHPTFLCFTYSLDASKAFLFFCQIIQQLGSLSIYSKC